MNPNGQINFDDYSNSISNSHLDTPVTNSEISEHVKDQRKDTLQQLQKLHDLSTNTCDKLVKISTVWPFHLFTKDVIVDINKVVLVDRQFVGSGSIKTINITDMADVLVETGLLFGKLTIVDRYFDDNTIEIDYLAKEDALYVHRVVQGLLITKREKVDLSKLNPEEILSHIENLGQSHSQL